MGERRFCYRCMEKYDMNQHICPHCGFDDNSPHNPMYITPGTVLHDRYMVGIMLNYNGEGASYVGYDISTGCKILIKEYMPANFCTRVKNKSTISVNYNNLAKYKAFMAEFTELNRALAQLRNNSNINPVLDMFSESNTTYAVFEYINGQKMLDYLKDNAGELSWEQVSKLFPPLFTTIGILHNAAIIHRAISPDTIYITSKGELKLSGFCISAVRTVDAGLEYELFKGYAAPEQYSANSSSRQGSWTDVYGLCALLYRALTGCMPVDSASRLKNDDLCEPAMLNKNIPAHVSKAIMDGMKLNSNERIQTITELVTRLFEQPVGQKSNVRPEKKVMPKPAPPVANENQGYTQYPQRPDFSGYQEQPQYYPPPPPPPPQRRPRQSEPEEYRYEKVSTVDKIKVPVIITILLLAILIILAVFIMRVFVPSEPPQDSFVSRDSSSLSENIVTDEPSTEEVSATEAKPDTQMPDLIGKFYSYTKKKYEDYFQFEPIYEYDDENEEDIITYQDIEPGTQVAQGCIVNVKVSKGKVGGNIPEYKDMTVAQYENELKKAGISNYSLVVSSSLWGTPNTITQLQVDGKEVKTGTYYSNKDDKQLIIYYLPENAEVQTQATYDPNYYVTTTYTGTNSIATTTVSGSANSTTTAVAVTTAPSVVTDIPEVTDTPQTTMTNPPATDPPPVWTNPPATVAPPENPGEVEEW